MGLHEILHMGGYAIYVWPAYAITLTVFAINLALSLRETTQTKKLIRRHHES
jgi:heme exporter protein CcmD